MFSGHCTGLRPTQVGPPDVEELSQREGPLHGRLDVDKTVLVMRVEPIEARPGLGDADLGRHRHRMPSIKELQLRVNVLDRTLCGIAVNPVNGQASEEALCYHCGGRRRDKQDQKQRSMCIRKKTCGQLVNYAEWALVDAVCACYDFRASNSKSEVRRTYRSRSMQMRETLR